MKLKRIFAMFILLSMVLSVIAFQNVIVSAEDESLPATETVYFSKEYSKPEDVGKLVTHNCVSPIISTSDDGKSVLRLENTVGTNGNASGFFYLAGGKGLSFSIDNKPQLVLEYKVRLASHCHSVDYITTAPTNELSACINKTNLLPYANTSVILATIDRAAWNKISVVYSNTDGSRKIYLNGELVAERKSTDEGYKDSIYSTTGFTQFTPTFVAYMRNLGDYCEIDYTKLYTISDTLNVEKVDTYENLNEIYVDFDSTVFNVSSEMFALEGNSVLDAEIVDMDKNIVKVVLEDNLEYLTEYTLTVDGVSNIGDVECNQEISFTTRDKMFRTVGISLVDMMENPVKELYSGDFTYSATFANDFDDSETLYLYGVQYDEIEKDKEGRYVDGGFMNKTDIISENVIAEKGYTFVTRDVHIEDSSAEFSTFAWQGKEIPVPVSPVYNISDTATELSYGYTDLAESEMIPEITAEITEKYDGFNIKVVTGEADSRTVGLLVKYGGEIEYIANKKSQNGVAEFFVPVHQNQVGYYSVTAGVEKGKYASLEEDIEFYSPTYISTKTDENINSEEAGNDSAADYADELGKYLGMDMEGLGAIEDKERVYTILFNLRALQEEAKFADSEAVVKAFATAVKMAKLYEGKEGASIIETSDDLGTSEETLNTFSNTLSSEGKAYVAEKLKGVSYGVPSDMQDDLIFHIVTGAVYKAPHYSNVDTIIKEYGEEIGIRVTAYNALKQPNKVASALLGKLFTSYEAFADAANDAISAQARAEAQAGDSRPSGGGGGGGGRVSSNQKYPTVNEKKEEKEEVKAKSYSDVKENDWFYNDIMWATEKGMFIGTSETTFTPGMNLTWEQIAIVLGRIGHKLENKNGNADISRGDFAEVLYNFLADKNVYPTRDEWIAGSKIFIGDQNGDMMFEKTLTRAECCTVLRRIESK